MIEELEEKQNEIINIDDIIVEKEDILNNFEHIFADMDRINDTIALFKLNLSELQEQMRNCKKNLKKEIKKFKKNKVSKLHKPRLPSGFAKPGYISTELCKFMGIPEETKMARTDVTKFLINYIKENELQYKTEKNKNKILPDEKLKQLLKIDDNVLEDLTFFSMQKYMTKHFTN
jgi:chromatin remodeling complex protein RSC6